MACRRRHGGITRSATFKEDVYRQPPEDDGGSGGGGGGDSFSSSSSSSSAAASQSLAAQAIRASAAHRDSSLSSAYAHSPRSRAPLQNQGGPTYDYTSMKSTNESSFWGVLARKAKAILEDDSMSRHFDASNTSSPRTAQASQHHQSFQTYEGYGRMDNPTLRRGLDALTSSLNQIGGTIGNASEEGRSIGDHRTSDMIQETRKMQNRRRGDEENQAYGVRSPWQQASPQSNQLPRQTSQEDLLKASRDVAMATAAKAKLLLRELKTVKADLTFAKQRCSQLEEENRMLRESREKGSNPADDDLIRLQLETLLAEKARLANENAVYARENRFLREIVEYHQLTMQDVVYVDEGIEEVAEVYPMVLSSPPSPASPRSLPDTSHNSQSLTSPITKFPLRRSTSVTGASVTKYPVPLSPQHVMPNVPKIELPPSFSSKKK